MNKSLIILLATLSCLSVNCIAQNLSLYLNLDSKTFIESQDIWVTASVVNHSSDTLRIRRGTLSNTLDGLRFTLYDNQGKKIPPSGDVTGGDWSEISIPPHDSIAKSYDILGEFNTSGNYGAPYNHTVHYLKAGWYLLDAKTFAGKDTLRAATVRFEVRERSKEEAKVVRLLITADSAFTMRDKNSVDVYESILNQYPNSVYSPYVYSRLIFICQVVKVNKSHALSLVEQFAKHHPNNVGALREVQSNMPEFIRLNRKGVIEALARDHAATKVGKYCKQKLQELQSIKLEK